MHEASWSPGWPQSEGESRNLYKLTNKVISSPSQTISIQIKCKERRGENKRTYLSISNGTKWKKEKGRNKTRSETKPRARVVNSLAWKAKGFITPLFSLLFFSFLIIRAQYTRMRWELFSLDNINPRGYWLDKPDGKDLRSQDTVASGPEGQIVPSRWLAPS